MTNYFREACPGKMLDETDFQNEIGNENFNIRAPKVTRSIDKYHILFYFKLDFKV